MVYEAKIDPSLADLFRNSDKEPFPAMTHELPPEKSLKARLLEQEDERISNVLAHEKRFSTEPVVIDDVFMSRLCVDSQPGCSRIPDIDIANVFRDDLESCTLSSSEDEEEEEEPIGQISTFEMLHAPRKPIVWSEQELSDFDMKSRLLDMRMDHWDLARIANVPKRIAKGETVNLRMPRYSAEVVKQRIAKGVTDIFGHFSLVPHTLTKSHKPVAERKQILIERYHDLMNDFDYATRPGSVESKKYANLTKRLNLCNDFLSAPKLPHRLFPRLIIRSIRPPETPKEPVKRKMRESESDDSVIIIPRKIEKEKPRPTTENVVLKKVEMEKKRPRSPELVPKKIVMEKERPSSPDSEAEEREHNLRIEKERHQKELEFRREALRKREQEREEHKKRAQEELRRQMTAALEESTRRQAEMNRQIEDEARKRDELQRIAEEKKRKQLLEDQCRAKQEKEKRDAEELEQMRLNIARLAGTKDVENALKSPSLVEIVPPSDARAFEMIKWNAVKCKIPENWEKRKDKFYRVFEWPSDAAQRDIERDEVVSIPRSKPIVIPQEDTYITRNRIPLKLPPKVKQAVPALVVRNSNNATRTVVAATVNENGIQWPAETINIDEVVREIRGLMAPTRRNFAISLSPKTDEIDYQAINLNRLKSGIVYPFYFSDGLYWPLVFLKSSKNGKPEAQRHVEALTSCKSFSGKYASRYLLTTTKEEDSATKKFEDAYADSDGDWADYSTKPGRFSNRAGFKPHYDTSNDSFEVQKQRAVDSLNSQYEKERNELDAFGRYTDEYRKRKDRAQYQNHIKTHLRELVRDARLDAFSFKEEFKDFEGGFEDYPGTRVEPYENDWYSHGYTLYSHTRDAAYADYMHDVCKPYEDMLPPTEYHEIFNEWCFTPMLASLHYQLKKNAFDVLSPQDVKDMEARHRKYIGLVQKERKFSLEQALDVCKLTDYDKRQWTILHDQLVTHFKDFPSISGLVYDRNTNLLANVNRNLKHLFSTIYRDDSPPDDQF
ncbi:uncharacterized protein CELE_D1044.6 [Caenorhabditis elegans]|uniref:Uncharacterized protein D1044.6 n=1 Tax=Caenorhabditis elegans TaxID=6239 RepID=YLK6_CAEEL|nr:Uncharacterized protein CELE_D1044.6 [Caenorhabditis elegans]P41954.3 RecName: Full=Uncharacterized protein D1044.6 [Caenorhabditis elegans]CCD68376.1 Uncharacterized protein CELE_D1044.6 [Caenorhabditis elegans]|eukprot:NP_498184.3 Uncharacterized protein CELE_D1044.6 [Caenorhabditis elegans]